jgi:hypothetical protein
MINTQDMHINSHPLPKKLTKNDFKVNTVKALSLVDKLKFFYSE